MMIDLVAKMQGVVDRDRLPENLFCVLPIAMVKAAIMNITDLRAMLKELEWAGEWSGGASFCPSCGFGKDADHMNDCKLSKLLGDR